MFKQIYILFILLIGCFSLCANNLYLNENNYCIGTWDVPTSQSIPLIYQGEIVKVTNGTFCTKMSRLQKNIAFLFIDIKYIKFDSEGNNVSTLYIDPNTPEYEYYRLSKVYAPQNYKSLESRFTWRINQDELPVKKNTSLREIPSNTIIVPLPSTFFEHTNLGGIKFKVDDWNASKNLIRLPNPIFDKNSTTDLENEINEVYCALPTLKVIHSPQEMITLRADKVEVSFVK